MACLPNSKREEQHEFIGMKKQRIVFVNRFCHPDVSATAQILSDLANSLAEGADVHLVASSMRYDDAEAVLPPLEHWDGITIHRVWTSRFGRKHLLGRLLDYLTFYITAPLKSFQLSTKDTVLVAMTDPPMISIPLAVVARLRGAKLVNWLQDLFPQVAIALGMRLGGALVAKTLIRLRNMSLRAASTNVVLGARMGAIAAAHAPHVPVRIVANWSPTAEIVPLARTANPLNTEWQLGEKFVVGYSGNLGRAHELGVLLDAAAILKPRADIVFLIIGEGNQKEQLQRDAIARGLTNIIFKPYQPKALLKFSLTLPDVHLVSLKPELEGLIVPSKFYSSIAAGRPVIFIGAHDGEIAQEIERGGCGITVPPGSTALLVQAIERLCDDRIIRDYMASNARKLFERDYDQPIAIAKWKDLLTEIAASTQSR